MNSWGEKRSNSPAGIRIRRVLSETVMGSSEPVLPICARRSGSSSSLRPKAKLGLALFSVFLVVYIFRSSPAGIASASNASVLKVPVEGQNVDPAVSRALHNLGQASAEHGSDLAARAWAQAELEGRAQRSSEVEPAVRASPVRDDQTASLVQTASGKQQVASGMRPSVARGLLQNEESPQHANALSEAESTESFSAKTEVARPTLEPARLGPGEIAKGAVGGAAGRLDAITPKKEEKELLLKDYIARAKGPCIDKHSSCGDWAKVGECKANRLFMKQSCAKSCGLCGEGADQAVPGEHVSVKTHIERRYDAQLTRGKVTGGSGLTERVLPEAMPTRCIDQHVRCGEWSRAGECDRNVGFMHSSCRQVGRSGM